MTTEELEKILKNSKELTYKTFPKILVTNVVMHAQLETIMLNQCAIMAMLTGQELEAIKEANTANVKANIEKANRVFYDWLANNIE